MFWMTKVTFKVTHCRWYVFFSAKWREFWPAFTLEIDLDKVKMNQHATQTNAQIGPVATLCSLKTKIDFSDARCFFSMSFIVVEIRSCACIDQWKFSASTKGSTYKEERSCLAGSSHWNTAWKRARLYQVVFREISIRGCTSVTSTATRRRAIHRSHTLSSFTSAKCRAVSETGNSIMLKLRFFDLSSILLYKLHNNTRLAALCLRLPE